VTFRAAGTSLSGQAVTDSVLITLGEGFRTFAYDPQTEVAGLGPSLVGGDANRLLSPFGRKIGPDPASIATAKIGGIAANNASGMCCGTGQNSYHTMTSMRVALSDGAVLDTCDPASVAAFRSSHAALLDGLAAIARDALADPALAARIRDKFRLKNTTGYAINALVDFEDPIISLSSDDRLGRHARLHFAHRLQMCARLSRQGYGLCRLRRSSLACRAVSALKRTPSTPWNCSTALRSKASSSNAACRSMSTSSASARPLC